MPRFALLLILSAALAVSSTLEAQSIAEDSCRIVAKRFEALSNLHPEALASEAPRTLSVLRQGETPNYYFICYNIYVENLFNRGHITKARQEMNKMLREAIDRGDDESTTVGRRAEGQFYYKIGAYDRAAECFRKGMATCPDYKHLRSYYTYSSTATWLAQADLRLGQLAEADQWLARVAEMMTWLETHGHADPSGHNQVRVKALMAQLRLAQGGEAGIQKAKALLAECRPLMQERLPKRAYTDYYVAQMELATAEQRNAEALNLLDTLIAIHRADYRPIVLDYTERKADILAAMGRSAEAMNLYKGCLQQKQEVDNIAITQQLDEIRTQHEVEILQRSLRYERRMWHLAAALFLLSVLTVAVIVWVYVKVRAKNRVLINTIREQERDRELKRAEEQATKDAATQAQTAQGRRVVDYMKRTAAI